MGIEAIFLYGSWARGDQGEKSDNDLLMVTDEAHGYHVTDGHHSMTYYPLSTLKQKAVQGDLFVYHIVLEAKVVLDPNNILGLLRDLFRPKPTYELEIMHGGDVGWYLVHRYRNLPEALAAKRVAWSVRTILIARSAMSGRPIFAPDKLPAFSRFGETESLIGARHGNFAVELIEKLRSFLEFERLRNPLGPDADENGWRRHFAQSGNYVGVQLIKAISEDALTSPYG